MEWDALYEADTLSGVKIFAFYVKRCKCKSDVNRSKLAGRLGDCTVPYSCVGYRHAFVVDCSIFVHGKKRKYIDFVEMLMYPFV